MLTLLPILIGQVLCQLCEQPIKYESYQFSINVLNPKSAQIWNYDDLNQVNPNCPATTSNLKDIQTSVIQLLDLQIILDIPENLTITRNRTAGPIVQYKTDGIKMRIQGINNDVSYQSEFFQFTYAEHNLDFQSQTPNGELQIFMIQDQLYQLCQVEPMYSVISFPIYTLSEQQPLKFSGQFNMNTDTISDFNFKQNILGTIKSDTSSYITYKAPINIPPCSTAYWYVSTNPIFFKQDQLDQLLQQNQYNGMRRAEIDNTAIQYNKGKILFYGDVDFADYDDTVEWAATWVASIIPCLIFAIVVCVYGQYEISNIGRYTVYLLDIKYYLILIKNQIVFHCKRPQMKNTEPEIEMLNQEEKQEQ